MAVYNKDEEMQDGNGAKIEAAVMVVDVDSGQVSIVQMQRLTLLALVSLFRRFASCRRSALSAQRSALARSLAFVNEARPLPFPPIRQHANDRQKSKNYTQGISAGAKGAKYKTKYRELKKKVKDIGTMSQPDPVFV